MAAFAMIIGGFFGMVSAMTAMFAFGATFVVGILLWMAVGTAAGIAILAWALAPRAVPAVQIDGETA